MGGRLQHIRIVSGPLVLDYQATELQAQNVAEELRSGGYKELGLEVTVDYAVADGMPPLPCGELWE